MIFHLSLLVDDLDTSVVFYRNVLGCEQGRRAATWVDIDFFGHQLSLHLGQVGPTFHGTVDGVSVPMPHFGVILDMTEWRELTERIAGAGVGFALPPYIRFEGTDHEQGSCFVADPAGNHLEFKGTNLDLLAPTIQKVQP